MNINKCFIFVDKYKLNHMKILGKKSLSAVLVKAINIVWWIQWIASAVLLTAVVITSLSKSSMKLNVPVTFSSGSYKQIATLSKNTTDGIVNVVNGSFSFDISTSFLNTLILFVGLAVILAFVILITYQLKLIFSSFRQNSPFYELNINRIRNIGSMLIIFSILQWLSDICINEFLISHFKWGDGIALTYHFNVSYLIAGLLLIIVAEIFKLGAALEEENKLTI